MLPRTTRVRVVAVGCALVWFASLAHASGQNADASPRTFTIDALVARTLDSNPELQSLAARADASRLDARAARGAFPQPRIEYSVAAPLAPDRHQTWEHMVGVMQAVPWRRARHDAADPAIASAERLEAEADALALTLAYETRVAALDVLRARERTAIVRRQRAVYADALEHTLAAMPHGGADHADALRIRLMADLMVDELRAAETAEQEARAALSSLASLGETARWDVDAQLGGTLDAAIPEVAALVDAARSANPQIAMAVARAAVAREQADVARNGALPTPMVGLGVGVMSMPAGGGAPSRDRTTSLRATIELPIPVLRAQYNAAESARLTEADAALLEADEIARALSAQVAQSHARLVDATERVNRFDVVLLPTAEDVTAHYAIEVAQGERSHTELLMTVEQSLALSLRELDARHRVELERARLDWLTAGAFSNLTRMESANDAVGGER
jgi:outer membrane protein TolC